MDLDCSISQSYFKFSEATLFPDCAVARNAVISASLDVQTHEVMASALPSLGKETQLIIREFWNI